MNLLVDGVERSVPVEPGMSLLAVLKRVDTELGAQERMMVSVNVDGREISPQQLEEASAKSVASMQTVHVRSEPIAMLVDRELSGIEECLPALSQTVRELAALFQEGKLAEALESCQRVTEIWMDVVSRERRAAGALQLDLDDLEVDDKPISAHHAELNQFLQEALRAMERGDYVLLGDLFEHELAPRLDTELRIVDEFRKSLRKKPA